MTYSEKDISDAIQYVNLNPKTSIRKISIKFKIPPSTLRGRLVKNANRMTGHIKQQKFTPFQEEIILEYIKFLIGRGIFIDKCKVVAIAKSLLVIRNDISNDKRCEGNNHEECNIENCHLGRVWFNRFIIRHPEIINAKKPNIAKCRTPQSNFNNYKNWLNKLTDLIIKFDLQPCQIFNIDETGIQINKSNLKINFNKKEKSTNVESCCTTPTTSVIECVSGTNTRIRPFIIFNKNEISSSQMKFENHYSELQQQIKYNSTGSTTSKVLYEWLVSFNTQTQDLGTRLLILDGHSTHLNIELIKYANNNNIELFIFNNTYYGKNIQPLNQQILEVFKKEFRSDVSKANIHDADGKLDVTNWIKSYVNVCSKVFVDEVCSKSWESCGLVPFDRRIIFGKIYGDEVESDDSLDEYSI